MRNKNSADCQLCIYCLIKNIVYFVYVSVSPGGEKSLGALGIIYAVKGL